MPPVAPTNKPLDQVMEYVHAIEKYKWHIAVSTLAMTLALTVLIARLPNVYEATTTILVDPQQIPDKIVAPLANTDPSARLNTITQQVLSRSRLQQIIDDQQLYSELRNKMTSEELVDKMRDDVTIQVKQGSGSELSAFTISYQGRNPETVAHVANELATSFIKWNVNSRVDQVNGTKEFLTSELQESKRNLEAQEDKLREFKMAHLGETPDQTVNNLQAIANLRAALQANVDSLNRLEQDKVLLTRLPEQVPQGSSAAPTTLSARGSLMLQKRQLEANIDQLKEHYSDKYPDVVRTKHRLDEINAQISALPPDPPATDDASETKAGTEVSASAVRLELDEKEMKRLKVDQAKIQNQIDSYQAKVDAAPLREQQLVELSRNYDISKAHYQTLLDKSFNIDMAADLEQKQKAERFTVLDEAQVPEKPVKPRRKMLIPASGLFAFGLAIMVVLAKQTINPAIKTEAELKSMLPPGVKVVGLIPRIETVSDKQWKWRWAVLASVTCVLLFIALAEVLWRIRPVL
jgi:succinoglycan biosynthesis transport protein ExoP